MGGTGGRPLTKAAIWEIGGFYEKGMSAAVKLEQKGKKKNGKKATKKKAEAVVHKANKKGGKASDSVERLCQEPFPVPESKRRAPTQEPNPGQPEQSTVSASTSQSQQKPHGKPKRARKPSNTTRPSSPWCGPQKKIQTLESVKKRSP